MKKIVKIVGGVLAALVVLVVGAAMVMVSKANARLDEVKWTDVKGVDVAVPWPLSEAEKNALREEKKQELAARAAAASSAGAGEAQPLPPTDTDLLAGIDLVALAKERSIARGKHLIDTRIGCTECHGADFGGKVIYDIPPMGVWAAPNITAGGNTKDFKGSDWDRIVRHGVAKDSTSTTMPSIDFATLSDRDLSDVISYITSLPPVTRANIPNKMGPIRAMLINNGTIPVSAELIDHKATRPAEPPPAVVNTEFGKHVANACVGCHRMDFSGGPVPGGAPDWPPAGNLTPHETGLKGWTFADFRKVFHEGKSKDGRELKEPMKTAAVSMKGMTDVELEAAFTYLQSLAPLPKGK